MRSKALWILGLVAVLAAAPALARVDFIPIPGGEFLTPTDMTADGSKILLYGNGTQYVYTMGEGLVDIGGDYCGGGIPRMSSDGSTIVSTVRGEDGYCQTSLWLGGQEWLAMGSEPGGLPCGSTLSSVYDTNNDTAVGLFWRPQLCRAIGGTWDLTTGTAGPVLPSTVPDRPTRGNGITDDGSIIVGWQDAETGERQAVRWVNGVQEFILADDGRRTGEATGVNWDGTVVWGTGYAFDGTGRGWLWRDGIGMIPMARGGVGRNIQSVPLAATEDGSVVIGITRDYDLFIQTGWIWNDQQGWKDFNDFMKGQTAAGWTLDQPTLISADGRFIVGRGFTPDFRLQAWIIDTKAKGPKQ